MIYQMITSFMNKPTLKTRDFVYIKYYSSLHCFVLTFIISEFNDNSCGPT